MKQTLHRLLRNGFRCKPILGLRNWCYARLPKSLYTRSVILVVAQIIVLQCVVLSVFMDRHWEMVTKRLSIALSREVGVLVDLLTEGAAPPLTGSAARQFERVARKLNLRTRILSPATDLPSPPEASFFNPLERYLYQGLTDYVGYPFWVGLSEDGRRVIIRIQMDAFTLQIMAPKNRAYASKTYIFVIWVVTTSVLLIVCSLMIMRKQIRPIEELARAAKTFGKNQQPVHLKKRGALEVRCAIQAFLDMQERIHQSIGQRTRILAGVSHDLKTLLTRFQLQVALMPADAKRAALQTDIDQMTDMLSTYLSFARGQGEEKQVSVTMSDFITVCIDDFEPGVSTRGIDIKTALEKNLNVSLKPLAFRRCFVNLFDNACRYAQKTVMISCFARDTFVHITIEDDGPGICASSFEQAFEPFMRLDGARGLDTGQSGHTGLGLAIARDCARLNGGDVTLQRGEKGGLQAHIVLPLSPELCG